MKTSCFFAYTGPGRISIARFAPRNTPAGYRIYKRLAPGEWFNRVSYQEYVRLFHAEILAPLDPQTTWNELHALASPAEPVMLCWETPAQLERGKAGGTGFKDYCHRQLVAAWFERSLGIEIPELTSIEIARAGGSSGDNPLKLTCVEHHVPLVRCGRGYRCPQCPAGKEAQAL